MSRTVSPTPDFPWALKLGKYSLGFELEPDMHTIKAGPFEVLPGCQATAGTGFEGHGFYEASSPRKIGNRYYLVYSSEQSHDLCYAVSDQPLTGYRQLQCLLRLQPDPRDHRQRAAHHPQVCAGYAAPLF